jgi:hypothetical protein
MWREHIERLLKITRGRQVSRSEMAKRVSEMVKPDLKSSKQHIPVAPSDITIASFKSGAVCIIIEVLGE